MPRGNDAVAAEREFRARLGGVAPNAEELIKLNASLYPKELKAANNKPIDHEATDALSESEVQSYVGSDRTVADYAVRGGTLVVVSVGEDGYTLKQAFVLEDKPAPRMKTAPRSEPEPEPEPEHRRATRRTTHRK